MHNPEWKFILANSADLSSIGELHTARDKALKVALNKPGGLSFSMALTDQLAYDVAVLKTCVIAYQNNEARWSGPIVTTTEDCAANKLDVNAVGWLSRLAKRITLKEYNFPSTDSGLIATTLLNDMNNFSESRIMPEPFDSGKNVSYAPLVKFTNIATHITNMADEEDGFDFDISWDRTFKFYLKRGVDKSDIKFGYNKGPSNLSNLVVQTDGDQMVNDLYVTPSNAVAPGYAQDTASVVELGMSQENISLTDPKDTVPTAFAVAELVVRSQPRIGYTLSPMKPNAARYVPVPFKDYDVGDTIYLQANKGRTYIQQQKIRVFGFDISIDNNSSKGRVTSIQTTYSS